MADGVLGNLTSQHDMDYVHTVCDASDRPTGYCGHCGKSITSSLLHFCFHSAPVDSFSTFTRCLCQERQHFSTSAVGTTSGSR